MGKTTAGARAMLGAALLLLPLASEAATLTTICSFRAGGGGHGVGRGAVPESGLVSSGGSLFGTTLLGGSASLGTVFRINRVTTAEKVLHSFAGGSDGATPWTGTLLDFHGTLYGTTEGGGTSDLGTVFSVVPSTEVETVLYSFGGGSDGAQPAAGLLNYGGAFYGTTYGGGTANYGTIFKIDPTTGAETVLYTFLGGSDGGRPNAALINVGGTLYGTTYLGGTSGVGTVFSISPRTGAETVVHVFTGGTDGITPLAPLIDVGGVLYGTTYAGGQSNCGTVFQIDPTTGAEKVLHAFQCDPDGGFPATGLLNVNGILYGTTVFGGTANVGTIYKVNATTKGYLTDYSFLLGDDGGYPRAPVINVNGVLYGTTSAGGSSSNGTVFSFAP